jgi:uncharacterized membrane protein
MSGHLMIVIAVVGWGLWGVCDKIALRSMHPSMVQSVNVLVGVAALPFYFLLYKRSGMGLDVGLQGLVWAVGGAALTWLASLACVYALRHNPASTISGYTCAYPVITLLAGNCFLGESFSLPRAIGVLLIVTGAWFLWK